MSQAAQHAVSAPPRGFTPTQQAVVRAVLVAAGARAAFVFGSRARGDARVGSDLDLAVAGLGAPALVRLREALDEAPLPFACDVVDLDTLADGPLRSAIVREGRTILGTWTVA